MHIGYFQDASIIALRVLNVWQAWYFGDLHAHLYRYAIANCVAGVVLRVHSLLSRCEYYRIAIAKRVAGVVLWRS